MDMSVKERISKFIQSQGITVNKFERKSGLSNGYLRQLRNEPSPTKIRSIIAAFPELSERWLLTGEGPMLRSEGETQTSTGDNSPNLNESPAANVNCGGMSEEFVAGLLEQKDKEIDRLLRIIDNLTSRRD